MRLYLSSYRVGNHIDALLDLVAPEKRVAIIENALDHISRDKIALNKQQNYDVESVFQNLGFSTSNIDLKDYFNDQSDIEADLRKFDLIWSCGGNAFLLRRAMKQSGFDIAIKKLLHEDALVYGGWSAGICVLGNTLKGIELCDNPDDTAEGYNAPIIWDGLGILDYSIAPHFRSEHPETHMIENMVDYFKKENMPYVALRDGDVIVYKDDEQAMLKGENGTSQSLNTNKQQL